MARRDGKRSVAEWVAIVGAVLMAGGLVVGVLCAVQPGRAERGEAGRDISGTDAAPTCLAMTGGVTYTVLQDAIDAAGALAVVKVAAGTCHGTLSIQKSITVTGGWARDFAVRYADPALHTILDAQGAGRVVSVTKPVASLVSVVLDGLTLTGGDATGLAGAVGAIDYGGAVFAQGVDISIRNCAIRGNMASSSREGRGGGIATYLCDNVILSGNVISDNVASLGGAGRGGGFADQNGKVVLSANTFERNLASQGDDGYGGAVWLSSVSAALQGNVLRDNTASTDGTGYGGGLHAETVQSVELAGDTLDGNVASSAGTGYGGGLSLELARATLAGLHIAGNAATTGGGVWIRGGGATLARNWVVGNQASGGGGIWLSGVANARLDNNVVADNVVASSGTGAGVVVSGGDARLLHTTLARNSGGDGSGLLVVGGASAWLTNTIGVSHTVAISVADGCSAALAGTLWGAGDWANGANWSGAATSVGPDIVGDPGFMAFGGGAYHIGLASAALDAGIDAGITEDIDGHVRPVGNGVDLGADEALFAFLPLVMR